MRSIAAFLKIKRLEERGRLVLLYWCPGCEDLHSVTIARDKWSWNGDSDKPTFSPAVHVTSGHYVPSFKKGEACWCTYNAAHPREPSAFRCRNCDAFVIEGRVHFAQSCTHKLAGQIVELPAWRE